MANRRPIPDKINKNPLDALQGLKIKPMQTDEQLSEKEEKTTEQQLPETKTQSTEMLPVTPIIKEIESYLPIEQKNETPSKKANDEKIKVNLYLSSGIKRRLEKAQYDIRQTLPNKIANQVNLSLISETALEIVLDELDRLRENSLISRRIIEKIES